MLYSHDEHQQAQRVGKNAGQMKAEIQAAWAQSDTRAALEAALAELGYVLATRRATKSKAIGGILCWWKV